MMGNYSLGGLDPILLQQITDYVQPSPYATMARQDPTFAPAVAQTIDRMANGGGYLSPDTAVGVGQPLLSDHGDNGPSAMQIIGGVVSAPLRALGLVKEGLEDALGHRNSRMRDAQDLQLEIATKLGLISGALTQDQKQVIWPEQFAQDRAAYQARQTSPGDGAAGVNTNALPLPEPRKTGFVEWLTGETQRRRARQLAQAAMAQQAIEQNIKAEELFSERALGDLRRTQTEGAQWDVTQGYKYGDLEKMAGLGKDYAAIEAARANAAQSYASADYSRAAIGNLGADNARADAEMKRREVEALLRKRQAIEELRGQKLANRGKVLDLRRMQNEGPFGADTGYDRQGRAINLRQFLAAYNAADTKEKPGVLERYQIPTKMSPGYFGTTLGSEPEIDYEALHSPPVRTNAASPTMQPDTTSGDPYAMPSAPRAQQLAELAPKLDRSSIDNFVRSAKALGLSNEEIKALWGAGSQ